MSRSARLVRLVLVLGSLVIAIAWTQASLAQQKPSPGGYIVEHDADVQKAEPGTHNGGGQTIGLFLLRQSAQARAGIPQAGAQAGLGIGYHEQKEDEIYYILSGTGLMTIDGKSFEVGAGTAVFTRPGSSHGLKQAGAEDLVIMINYEQAPAKSRRDRSPRRRANIVPRIRPRLENRP